ncbi:Putative uncharacterized protein, chloroplastic [Termitomyces sp. J132]|nr:hypothetical protein H2248_005917 [Termitomyces sp. 'cryptogamus']KNZ73680.1 Putative uncharacterized protein, chloroplastic [Termitomyces sp. J132]
MASNTGQRVPPQFTSAAPHQQVVQSNKSPIKTVGSVPQSQKHDAKNTICRDFSKHGKCQYGDKCKFPHVQAPVDKAGISVRAQNSSNGAGHHQHGGFNGPVGERRPQSDHHKPSPNFKKASSSQPCPDWKDGKCKFGDRCRYSHPDTSHGHAIEDKATHIKKTKHIEQQAQLAEVAVQERSPGHAIEDKAAHIKKTKHIEQQAHLSQAAAQKHQAAEKARLANEAEGKRRLEAVQAQEAKRQQAKQEAARRQQAREKEEAARKARFAEQEAIKKAQLAEQEALQSAATWQHVFGSTLVSFSAGLEVKGLVTGFESCLLTIRNIPSDAKPQEIIDLFTQQGMSQHDVRVVSLQPTDDSHREAKVLTSTDKGRLVAVGLDGIEFRNETLEFEVGEIVSANTMGESNSGHADTLTITWFSPSLTMVATYSSMDIARQQQQSLNRKIVRGRRIKTEINRPPPIGPALHFYNPNSIKIMGIPIDTPVSEVESVAGSLSVRSIKSNIYDLQEFLRDLQQHLISLPNIRMVSFDRVKDKESDGLVTIKARFENWEDANTARTSLEGKRFRSEYPTFRLQLPPPLDFRSVIPIQQYEAQQRLWDTFAKDSSDKGPRVYIDKRANVAIIRLSGDEKRLVGALKVRVETLVAGEKLDAIYWHRSLLRREGREFLAKVFSSTKVYVRIDYKTQSLKIYGEGESKERARRMIADEVARLGLQEWTVFLKRQSVGYFVRKGLAALKELLGEDAVSLDLASTPCKLTIRGGENARHTLSNFIDQSLNDLDLGLSDSSNDICPICYDAVSNNPLVLGCKHIYCTDCIRHYITSASETKNFPLTCMGDEAKCKIPISIPVIRKFLPQQQFENLVNIAFFTYLDQHPQEFRYCTTPDCTQIYRANTQSMLKCPSCFAEVCSSCHEEAHEGMSCEDRQARKAQHEEQLNDSWATTHGVKRCPACSVYIEKVEGCNHMTCRCGVHICWICVRVFPAQQIYTHLGEVHGGPFDGDGDRRNLDLRHALALQHQLDEERNINVPGFPLRAPVQVGLAPVDRWFREEEGHAAERRERERREAEAQRLAAFQQRQRQEQEFQRRFNERQERVAREMEERRRNEGRGGCLIM